MIPDVHRRPRARAQVRHRLDTRLLSAGRDARRYDARRYDARRYGAMTSYGGMGEFRRYRTWGTGRAPRLAAACYPLGSVVHVVVGTAERNPAFHDLDLAREVFAVVAARAGTLAACLMPDHLHWLIRLETPLAIALRDLKSFTTRLAWARGLAGPLWQRSFYDRLIRDETQFGVVIEYLRQNPVRAALAPHPSAYPYLIIHAPH